MALAVVATLTGPTSPQLVKVVVTGLTVGVEFTVTGASPKATWAVRGGTGVADDSQVVLGDIHTPVNTTITYTVEQGGVSATSAGAMVAWSGSALMQSLDGADVAAVVLRGVDDPKALGMRAATFAVPGRERSPSRFDVPLGYSGTLVAQVTNTDLETLLRRGGLVMLRTDEDILDVPGADFYQVMAASSVWEWPDKRLWTLPYQLVDDPEPSTRTPISTWAEFDAFWATQTWDDFDTYFTGLDWHAFDAIDWSDA